MHRVDAPRRTHHLHRKTPKWFHAVGNTDSILPAPSKVALLPGMRPRITPCQIAIHDTISLFEQLWQPKKTMCKAYVNKRFRQKSARCDSIYVNHLWVQHCILCRADSPHVTCRFRVSRDKTTRMQCDRRSISGPDVYQLCLLVESFLVCRTLGELLKLIWTNGDPRLFWGFVFCCKRWVHVKCATRCNSTTSTFHD